MLSRRRFVGAGAAALIGAGLISRPAAALTPAARAIVLGGPIRPAFSWRFARDRVIPPFGSFSRLSSDTELNAADTLISIGNNVAAFPYDALGASQGYRAQESRQNFLLQSQDFSSALWVAGTGGTKTPNFAVAPDGTTTAARYQYNGSSIQVASALAQSPSASTSSATVTAAVWVMSNTGANQQFAIKNSQAGVADHVSGNLTATTSWQRFTYTVTNAAGGTGQIVGVASSSSNNTLDLLVWGFQAEVGAFATSYIPTTAAAATRDKDQLTIPTAAFLYNPNQGTMVAEVILGSAQSGTNIIAMLGTSRFLGVNDTSSVATTISTYDGFTAAQTPNTVPLNTIAKIASAWGLGRPWSVVANGGPVARSPLNFSPTNFNSSTIGIGGQNNGFNGPGIITIRSLDYYAVPLSDAQIQGLTR